MTVPPGFRRNSPTPKILILHRGTIHKDDMTLTQGFRITTPLKAIADLLVNQPVPFVRVRYEDLVEDPEGECRKMFDHLELPFEPAVIEYGKHRHITKSYGDPMSVEKHTRPVADSIGTWTQDLLARPDALELCRSIVDRLEPEHLEAWGYPKAELLAPLAGAVAARTRRSPLNGYRVKRQVLLTLRRNIHGNALGAAVRKVRYYCDVLLRT